MILSDFKWLGEGKGVWLGADVLYAEVLATAGFLWWKRSVRKKIYRLKYGVLWKFLETGEYTPGRQAEMLEERTAAQQFAVEVAA